MTITKISKLSRKLKWLPTAPDAKVRRDAQGVIETIEDNNLTVQEQEQQVIENNLSETKKIITKTANQANREVPKYTEAFS